MSSTQTGANGDYSGRFTDAAPRVDFEEEPSKTGGFALNKAVSEAENAIKGDSAIGEQSATWRNPENRGAGGEFDDWNPRGESGSGPAFVGTPSLGERVAGAVEKTVGKLVNDADKVDEGAQKQSGV